MTTEELKGKFAIVYDFKLDDGAVRKQALFFGFDSGLPCVLHDSAKLFDNYAEALAQLPRACRVGRNTDPDNLERPYIVEIPA